MTAQARFGNLRAVLDGDIVFANLETAVESDGGHIPKAPRILASPETIESALDALGVHVANLANNHIFDGYAPGFDAVANILRDRGIVFFGAGHDLVEAGAHRIMTVKGVRLGWLGYASQATVPSHVAGDNACGINPLSESRALDDVARLAEAVDHVVVSLHWGVEYCHLPAPGQICFARELIERGASLVLGHHAHVVQGVERHADGVIAYNLGNATTTDHYIDGRRAIRQSVRTRSSLVLRADLTKDRVVTFDQVPIRSRDGRVLVDDDLARKYVERANRQLRQGVSPWRWRRRRFLEDVVLRSARKLHPAVIRSVRPAHFVKPFRNVLRAARGKGPVS